MNNPRKYGRGVPGDISRKYPWKSFKEYLNIRFPRRKMSYIIYKKEISQGITPGEIPYKMAKKEIFEGIFDAISREISNYILERSSESLPVKVIEQISGSFLRIFP